MTDPGPRPPAPPPYVPPAPPAYAGPPATAATAPPPPTSGPPAYSGAPAATASAPPPPAAGPGIVPPPPYVPPPTRPATRSPLSDGEWHRMHPLTPLLQGGLFFVIVVGLVISNFRERIIELFLPGDIDLDPGDPIEFVLDHDLVALALLAVVVILAVLIGLFAVSWRFHTFRITGDDVEVRRGVLFRSHRRAPLDRVQGVNLTRPMLARLLGLAKLEVVGAGTDGNVKLEYLRTTDAETVRADILRLASGARLADAGPATRGSEGVVRSAVSSLSAGVTGIIEGVDEPVAEPESVVHIPVGRLVASRLLGPGTIWLVVLLAALGVAAAVWSPFIVLGAIPVVLATGGFWVRSSLRTLRYSIAPTPSGVRITFGLFTTVTEILPPGRVHAVEVRQSILWRPFGWWSIAVNRLSGRSSTENSNDQFTVVLPVGTRADAERVLRLLLPSLPEEEWSDVFEHGILGPRPDDPYTNTPRRVRLLRPLSWRRNGVLVTPDALFVRRGVVWRTLGIFPLARLQSIGLVQGPVARGLAVAGLHPHTIAGPVLGTVGALDVVAATALWRDAEAAAIGAAGRDRSHRWAGV